MIIFGIIFYIIVYLIAGFILALCFVTAMSDKNFNTMSILFFWPAYIVSLFVFFIINFYKLFKDACNNISNLIK